MTAMSAIEKRTVLPKLKRLMVGRDAVDVAGWAHQLDQQYGWPEKLHYQKYKIDPPADAANPLADYEQRCENLQILTDEKNCPGIIILGTLS